VRAARLLALLLGLAPAVVGYAVWRIERHHPLALRPRLSAPAPAVTGVGALPRLVLVVHYPWYGTPEGPTGRWRHWNHARVALPAGSVLGFHDPRRWLDSDRRDLGAAHYPAAGPYDSADPAVMRAQIAAARAAGLDGFAVSWWGRESEEARVLAALFAVAGPAGFRLAPYYEAGELWPRGGAGVAADLEALLDRHGRDPGWLRVDGRPVVFVYGSHRLRPPLWEYVRRRLRAGGRDVFLIGDTPRAGWLERFDALHVYTPVTFLARGRDPALTYREWAAAARAAGRPFIPAVAPGFDDRTIRRPGTLVERADGATYDATWRAALAVDPAWVLVASWNEWHEGSEIEASREHGTRYLEATRRWAARFRAGPP
jgi:hypothetical protein